MSLAAWQQRLGLPAQPLHRVAWLPSPAGGHRDSSRLLCVAVAAALERLGCDGLEAAAMTLGPPQRGTPLCAVLPRTEWRAMAPTLRRWRLQFVQQLLDADGRVRPYAHLHGGARAVQGAAVRAAPPWYARLVAALPAVPPPALDLSAPALGSLDVFCATLRVPAALAAHIAAAAARVTPASPLVAWTDGSAVLAAADQALLGTGAPAACGGAAVVFEACAEPADATVLACVAGAVSSYKCELVALLLALHIARDVPHLLLRTDSQAVVRALATQLAGTPPNPAAVCAAGRALRIADGELLLEAAAAVRARTARAFTTRLEWVRGHAGTLGNELADRAAAEARRLHPAALSAALRPVHTLGTSLVVGGRRLEGCVRRYARQRAVLAALEARTALREQGMAWSALVHAAPSAAQLARMPDPASALALRRAAHATVPRPCQPRTSAAWRSWGRRQLALMHCAAPTAAWLHRRGRAPSAACPRCGALRATTLHAGAECPATARLRRALRRALLRIEHHGTRNELLPHERRALIRQLLRAPIPVALQPTGLRVRLAEFEVRRRTAAYEVQADVAAELRDALPHLWRLIAPPLRAPDPALTA